MIIPVPTLSTQGWVSDQAGKIDYLLSHFFLADYNQTFLYRGQVTSLTEIIQRNGGEASAVIPDINTRLRDYLLRYYDSAEVTVKSATNLDTDPTAKIELIITMTIGDNGSFANYARLLQAVDSKMSQIVRLNNEGLAKITAGS